MKYILMCYTWKKIVTLAGNMTQAFAGHKREMWEHQQNRKKIQAIAIFEHQHATTYSTRMDVDSFEWGRKKNEASENGKKTAIHLCLDAHTARYEMRNVITLATATTFCSFIHCTIDHKWYNSPLCSVYCSSDSFVDELNILRVPLGEGCL